jgi:hypothetical protein
MTAQLSPADAIRELGRAYAYRETAREMHGRPTGLDPRAFIRAAAWLEFHRPGFRAALVPQWPFGDDPATVRRRAEALARQMELGAWIAEAMDAGRLSVATRAGWERMKQEAA